MKNLTRRKFLQVAAAAAACGTSKFMLAEPATTGTVETTLEIGAPTAVTMPLDFLGLSYESAQLADPTFFSAKNKGLVQQFRNLSACGSLRLGGCLSDFTNWWNTATQPTGPAMPPAIAEGQKRFEWILTTPSVSNDKYAVITPESIKELRGFLDATGWKAIYGLNLGVGTPERAADEGSYAVRTLGDKLAALQVGNEDDFFMHWKRPPTWGFEDYWKEYTGFVNAVHAQVPDAPFAGPDIAFIDWLIPYAERAQHTPVFLSSHYYRMGPAGGPGINAEKLLSPDPKLATYIERAQAAMKIAGLPYRMTEANSCSHGGMKGVSDAYASALWVVDFLLQGAQAGFAGINLHGGGIEGNYSPIVGDSTVGYTAHPMVQGMKLANEFAGATFKTTTFVSNGYNAVAYAAQKDRELLIAIINKGDKTVNCVVKNLPATGKVKVEQLNAPSLDSNTAEVRSIVVNGKNFSLPSFTALLIRSAI